MNVIDKLLGLYTVLFILLSQNYILEIIKDTPASLEYRYFIPIYFVLLYFSLRIGKVEGLIEKNSKRIIFLYGIILLTALIYFFKDFPVPFLNIYYESALLTLISLLSILSISIIFNVKSTDKLMVFIIAVSFSLASIFLLFYYWVVTMTYISPEQNYLIVPIMDNILRSMYGIFL